MYTPSPIIFGPTPAGGVTLSVTEKRGGLNGVILLDVSGPIADIRLNGLAPSYPATLQAGDVLFLQRSGGGAGLTTITALAPIDDGPAPGGGSGQEGDTLTLTPAPDNVIDESLFYTIEDSSYAPVVGYFPDLAVYWVANSGERTALFKVGGGASLSPGEFVFNKPYVQIVAPAGQPAMDGHAELIFTRAGSAQTG